MSGEVRPRPRRRVVVAAVLAACAGLAVTTPATAATPAGSPVTTVGASPAASPGTTAGATPAADPPAGEPWWVPAAFAGTRVAGVAVGPDGAVEVRVGGADLLATDGIHFAPVPSAQADTVPTLAPGTTVHSGGDTWQLRSGRILHGVAGGLPEADPTAPDLGSGARLLVAPAALPGTVVAVSDAGVVWRRGRDGGWSRALVLLPRGITGGRPAITSLTAFTTPLTTGVYLGTDGYSVLLTTDAGVDWLRGGPGLPDTVLGLASDPVHRAVWAATDRGLFVHHLRTLPAVPVYPGPALLGRRLGTAAVTAGGLLLAIAVLLVAARPGPWRGRPMLGVRPPRPAGDPMPEPQPAPVPQVRGYATSGHVAASTDRPPPLFAAPGTWSPSVGERSLYAGLPVRTAAMLIDVIPLLAVVAVLGTVGIGPGLSGAGSPLRRTTELLVTLAVLLVVVALTDALVGGTPGRRLSGLRVVRASDGASMSTAVALRRVLGLVLALLPLGIGVLWAAVDSRGQGWHDKVAGTVVLRRRR